MSNRFQILALAALATIVTWANTAQAQSPSADIDPGRLGFSNLPSPTIIDPQPLHVDRLPMNSIDPQALRMDNFHFQSIDPGKAYQAVIAPRWDDPQRLTMPGLGITKIDPGRLSIYEQDPGPIEPGRLRFNGQIFNPLDPGRAHVDPIEKTKIDPGAFARQGTERRELIGRSTIFLSSPGGPVGGLTPREQPIATSSAAATSSRLPAGDPRFMPLKW